MKIQTSPRALEDIERSFHAQLQRIALSEVKATAAETKDTIRQQMAAAGLGRLGFAIGSGGDRQVHIKAGGGWSVSGWVFIRSQSPRTVGAIISYTEGASIMPRRGRYLWIATDDVKRLVGIPTGDGGRTRTRLEPRLWDRTYGRTLGPLIPLRAKDGTPLLAVRNATVSLSGKSGSLKGLTRRGKVPKGQVQQEITVAFYGIPQTRRAARLDPRGIAQQEAFKMADRIGSRLGE